MLGYGKFKKVKTEDGDIIAVDISDETCGKFGVKHGEMLVDFHKRRFLIVEGVDQVTGYNDDVMFFSECGGDGSVFFSNYSVGSIDGTGYEKIPSKKIPPK
jgi:hypothetical protein